MMRRHARASHRASPRDGRNSQKRYAAAFCRAE